MALSGAAKEAENLITSKAEHSRRKKLRAQFEGKLTKKNRQLVNGYSGAVGTRD